MITGTKMCAGAVKADSGVCAGDAVDGTALGEGTRDGVGGCKGMGDGLGESESAGDGVGVGEGTEIGQDGRNAVPASVTKLPTGLQSPGMGTTALTRQK